MRTLHIMERMFRQAMLEELQLDPNIVYAVFPCLDQLTKIHSHFLEQLLQRRNNSLQSGSTCNFTIHQLGDILLEQVTCIIYICTPTNPINLYWAFTFLQYLVATVKATEMRTQQVDFEQDI